MVCVCTEAKRTQIVLYLSNISVHMLEECRQNKGNSSDLRNCYLFVRGLPTGLIIFFLHRLYVNLSMFLSNFAHGKGLAHLGYTSFSRPDNFQTMPSAARGSSSRISTLKFFKIILFCYIFELDLEVVLSEFLD